MFFNTAKTRINQLENQLNTSQAMLNAMDKVMAIIVFDLQGNILQANDNFLRTVGYSQADVAGKHHEIFVHQHKRGAEVYRKFWEELRSGKPRAGRFNRLTKQGKDIWLEASYNPIFDANGKIAKVVKFATDITQQVATELEAKAKINALNKVMAVIEFDMAGNILEANQNFLSAMGYQADDLIDQHHEIFVDHNFASSQEYQDFWASLNQGDYFQGTIKRIKKDGSIIWLEASYNPVLDLNGKPYKVVKFATDIGNGENVKLLNKVVNDATQVLQSFANGDLTVQIEPVFKADEENLFRNVIDQLLTALDSTSSRLSGLIYQANQSADMVCNLSEQVFNSTQTLNEKTQAQAGAVEETVVSMNEISQVVKSNTENAHKAADLVAQVQEKSTEGNLVMQQTSKAMDAISDSSKRIGEILTLIDSIAFQTNLLALNAAVEAARAGEHGRGFAVVAGEVRALAQKSAEAAKDIKSLIDESVQRVNQGNSLTNQSSEFLLQINQSINEVTKMIQQISVSSAEQFAGVRQVNEAVTEIGILAQSNSSLVEQTSHSARSMQEVATDLANNMASFTLK